ncbi:MAG: translocation/assembly module TamB domain-containing protein [Ignavibacteriae bacterium]|nr:translocation/assembly module TamB domain-containing protein [Ignavibacteria bacterium]MBI3364896.1 translocation/assembly module TamB domain-containing protein [Ignavibacteriota bacterium]
MKTLIRILKIIAYVGVIVVVLLVLLTLFTQTQFFKDRLRILLVSTLTDRINGTLHIGTIRGNFFNEISVDSLGISYNDQPVITSGKVTLQYELFPLLENKLKVRYFIIEQPKIYLIRSASGDWNFEKVMKSSGDTNKGEFKWTGRVDDLELKNGMITVIDSASLLSPEHSLGLPSSIEYHRFTAKDINIQLNGTFKKNDVSARVIHASCYADQPQFELTHFKGDFAANEHGLAASNMVVQTGRSYLEMDAKLRGANIFRDVELASLREDSLQLQLKASSLDFGELKIFIPQVDFLEGSAFVDLHAAGVFGDVDIQSFHLKTYQSTLNLSGTVRNLHRPEHLFLNIFVGESQIHPGNLARLLPPFDIPTFDSAGQSLLYAQFTGEPLNFTAKTILRGRFGELDANGEMNLTRTLPRYNLNFSTKDLNISRIFAHALSTSLSVHGNVKGEGFSLDSLNAFLSVQSDSSRIRKLRIDAAQVKITAAPHHIDANASLLAQAMRADVTIHGNFMNVRMPEFTSDISLTNFNLATLLDDDRFASDLTLRGIIGGSGSTIDDFSTDSRVTLLPSIFRGHKLDQQEIHLLLDQRDADSKHLSLGSSIADIDLSGRFDLDYASVILPQQLVNLMNAIGEHALPPESVKISHVPFTIPPHTAAQRTMDFDYTARIKDLGPIATLFSPKPFDAHADLNGKMSTSNDMLAFTCKGMIDEFYIGSSDSGAIVNHCAIALALDSLTNSDPLEHLSAGAEFRFGSAMINNMHLDSSALSLRYSRTRGTLSMQGIVDSVYRMSVSGETSIQPGTYVFDVDTFRFSSGQYVWRNNQDIQLRVNSEGTRVMHAEMVRNSEMVSLAGSLQYSGDIDVTAGLRNFDLGGLAHWLPEEKISSSGQGFSGKANADLHLAGSLTNPIITFAASADSVAYRQIHIGTASANISYKDTVATTNISVGSSKDSVPSLTIRGTLPINLAFSDIHGRFPDLQQDLHIVSQGFNLGVLDPLLGEFDNLSGNLTCDVTVGGTPRTPEFGGLITLRDVMFLFTPNYVTYSLNATLQPSGEHIVLQNFLVQNVATEGPIGKTQVTGSLTIKDYTIATFDMTAIGQLLVMSDATRRTDATLYGPLFTETDSKGLSLNGTLDRPFLSGKLFVREANLVSPPARAAGTTSQLALNRIVIDDTSRTTSDTLQQHKSKFFTGNGIAAIEPSRPNRRRVLSLVDRLRYNLTIETQGTTAIKMIFTPATNEELYAELDGSASVINNQGAPNVYGDIRVLPRSYYYFFRRFEAEGTLKFVGPWDNPELNITARYEGTRTIDPTKIPSSQNDESKPLTEQKVAVILDITGTRYEPKLVLSMKVQEPGSENLVDWSTKAKGGDVQSDAISFILTGKFRDDLTSGEQRDIASTVGSTASSGFTSNLLSGILTDVLRREFPFIRTAEFSYEGGNPNVRVTGEAFKGRFQVGAHIQSEEGRGRFDPNVSYQISVGDFLDNRSLRNLFIELQRRDTNFNDDKKTYETRIYYRFSF